MAKKDATVRKQKGKPVTAKSPEKAKREATRAKSPKPPKKKGGKEQQPLNREERKKAAWLRKTEHKVAQQAITEVGAKASAGLTFDQLKASGLMAKPLKPPAAAGPTFEQILLEVVAEQARQFESTGPPVSLPVMPEPEIRTTFGIFGGEVFNNIFIEDIVEPIGDAATRNVVAVEIHSLLEKTESIFSAYRGSGIPAAQSAAGELFEKEPEDSPLRLRAAEVTLAEDPMTVEDFLEEIWDRVAELQLIASALEPEGELEKSARLGLIEEAVADRLKKAAVKEAIRLDLVQRLAGLTAGTGAPTEVDETFATLIAEAAQAAEVQRRKRIAFRQTLSQRLRGRKEREGRRFSKSSEESGDEEFIQFLLSHRGDLAAVRNSLPFYLREQVETLLKEDERKGPFRRQIAAATAIANRLWEKLKSRLSAGADDPEAAVAQNATAMEKLLYLLAHIKSLRVQLDELDKAPERGDTEGAKWINQLNLFSKHSSRGPRGMRHLLQQVQPLRPGKETADKEDLARFLGRRGRMEIAPFAASLKAALA